MAKKDKKIAKKAAKKAAKISAKKAVEKSAQSASKRKIIQYIVLVIFFSILSIILTNQIWFEGVLNGISKGYAAVSNVVLNLFGQQTTQSGSAITSTAFSLDIKKGCDAVAPMLLLFFAIAAFPTTVKNKLKGIGIGLSLLAVVNCIRIISLYFIGKYTNPTIFDIAHVDVWQILFIIITLVFWLFWLRNSEIKLNTDGA